MVILFTKLQGVTMRNRTFRPCAIITFLHLTLAFDRNVNQLVGLYVTIEKQSL